MNLYFMRSKIRNFLKSFSVLFVTLLMFLSIFSGLGLASHNEKLSSQFQVKDQYLNGYIKEALLNSPELKSAFSMWKAALEQAKIVRSLPDPNFTFALFIEEVETRVGPQQGKIGLMQKFPWFGKLKLKGKRALKIAASLFNNYEKVKLDILYRVKKKYYDLYLTDSSIRILRDNITLLQTANDQIYEKYKTGIATYANLIRIQVELDKLKDQLDTLKEKRPVIRIELNSILNRPVDSEARVTDQINGLELNLSKEVLMKELLKFNPELKIIKERENAELVGIKLAKKNYFPDIAIGADYIFTGNAVAMAPPDSGKDPVLLKMSLNLPIRFKRINSTVKKAKLRLESLKQTLVNKKNILGASLEKAFFKFSDSLRKIKLYKNSLIPKANQAFEVTKTAFSTGKAGFVDFIDTQRTLLQFELKLEQSRTSYHKNLALIEKISGIPFSHTGKDHDN